MLIFLDEQDREYGALGTLSYTNSVNGERSISGEIYSNTHVLNQLDKGWRLRFNQEYYVVTYAKPLDKGNQLQVSFDAVHQFFWDFSKQSVYQQLPNGSHTFVAYLDFIFAGSGYQYVLDPLLQVKAFEKDSFGFKKRLTLFNDMISSTGVEFQVRGKVVRLLARVGTDLSTIVRKNFNMNELRIEKNINDFITYQKGFGAWHDENDHSKGRLEVAYESPLASVYGRLEGAPLVDERYKQVESLKNALKRNVESSYTVSVQLDLEDLTRAGYDYQQPVAGDYIMAINETLGFRERIRIVSFTSQYDVTGTLISHKVTCNDLGTVRKQESATVQSSKQIGQALSQMDTVAQVAQKALVSANGKNQVFFGTEMPLDQPKGRLIAGDRLYLTVGDETKLYYWNGAEWLPEPVVNDVERFKSELSDELQRITAQMAENEIGRSREMASLLAKANSSQSLAEEAKRLGQSAQADVQGALSRARVAKEEAVAEAERLVTVERQATELKIRDARRSATLEAKQLLTTERQATETKLALAKSQAVSEASRLVDGLRANLGNQLSETQTDLTQTKEAIKLLASKQTVDGLLGRVASTEASLQVQVDRIAQSVKKQDFDQASRRLSSAESAITQLGNRITTEIRETVAKIPKAIGSRNYAEDYDFSRGLWEYSQGDASAPNWQVVNGVYTVTGSTPTWRQFQLYSDSGSRQGGKRDSTALLDLEVGQTYTLSVEAKVNSGSPNIWLEVRDNGLANYDQVVRHGSKRVDVTSSWERYELTFTLKPNSDFSHRRIILGYSEVGSVSFRRVELVKGAVLTDAGPAPEDGLTEVESLKTTIRQTAKGVEQLSSQIVASERKMSTAETQIRQLIGDVSSKVSQKDFDQTKRLVNRQETLIQQTRDQIQLKADQVTTDDLIRQVSQAQSELRLTAKGLEGKVSQTDFDQVTGRLTTAETKLSQTVSGIEQLSRKVTASEQGLSTAETQIRQLVGEVSAKVAQTDFDRVKQTVDRQETAIRQTSSAILLKADKTVTDGLQRTVSQTQTDLTVLGNAVRTKVAQTDFDRASQRLTTAESSIQTMAGKIETKLSRADVTGIVSHSIEQSERGMTARISQVEGKIPLESSGNLLVDSGAGWTNLHQKDFVISEPMYVGSTYTITTRWWRSDNSRLNFGLRRHASDSWQWVDLAYHQRIDAWTATFTLTKRLNAGDVVSFFTIETDGRGSAAWATLTKGNIPLSVWEPSYKELVTTSKFHEVRDTVDSHTRTIAEQGQSLSQVVQTANGLVTRVENLSVGGRNWVRGSSQMRKGSGTWESGTFRHSGSGRSEQMTILDFPGNELVSGIRLVGQGAGIAQDACFVTEGPWTMSYWVNGQKGTQVRLQAYWSSSNSQTGVSPTVTLKGGWERLSFSAQNREAGRCSIAYLYLVTGQEVVVARPQLENGALLTDYRPAPEDGETALQAVSTQTSHLAGSYAIRNLTSSGTILNQLNLNRDGSVKIDGQLVQITGQTYIQDGVITSAKIADLDAGKIRTGQLNAANVDIVNLNVNQLVGLDASFIRSKIEYALIDWLKGKTIAAQNGAMMMDLNEGALNFFTENPAMRRAVPGYGNQFIKFATGHFNQTGQWQDSFESNQTIIGSNRNGIESVEDGGFAGFRIWNMRVNNGRQADMADMIDVIGDRIVFQDAATGSTRSPWILETYSGSHDLRFYPRNDNGRRHHLGAEGNKFKTIHGEDIYANQIIIGGERLAMMLKDLANKIGYSGVNGWADRMR
ncbi:gp58-like family protein [Streptococcus cuniculipharyngis]|uniref:Uncharacterized protein n=1 Tax=Streptococcus cuniculipharyngis TaxID=1562651 RepID=A0A5C5SDV1_9STRE|nr:gp58-like family protein [Streptococcus cuniculipharyngis]TWS99136.1 hypothetical protein FRX57_02750 [Streptococcus cuniculipharyngis]